MFLEYKNSFEVALCRPMLLTFLNATRKEGVAGTLCCVRMMNYAYDLMNKSNKRWALRSCEPRMSPGQPKLRKSHTSVRINIVGENRATQGVRFCRKHRETDLNVFATRTATATGSEYKYSCSTQIHYTVHHNTHG